MGGKQVFFSTLCGSSEVSVVNIFFKVRQAFFQGIVSSFSLFKGLSVYFCAEFCIFWIGLTGIFTVRLA